MAKNSRRILDFAKRLLADVPIGQPTSLQAWRRTVRRLRGRVSVPALDPRLHVEPTGFVTRLDAKKGHFVIGHGVAGLRVSGAPLKRLWGRNAVLRFEFFGPTEGPYALHYDLGKGLSPMPGRPLRVVEGENLHRLHVPFGTHALIFRGPAGTELMLRRARLMPSLRKRKKSRVESALETFEQGGGLLAFAGLEYRAGTEDVDPTLRATDGDPRLVMARPPQHRGFYILELDERFDAARCVARFYPTYGREPKEEDAISLPVRSGRMSKRIVHFAKAPRAMRFDPVERPGAFEITHLAFVPVSERFAIDRMVTKLGGPKPGESTSDLYDRYDAIFRARSAPVLDYSEWIAFIETPSRPVLSPAPDPVRFSLVMPTYETDPTHLRAALDSILSQSYPHFELCIADDASPSPHVVHILEEYGASDPRVRFTIRDTNGRIAAATNTALAMATGEYVVFVDHDDLLDPDALLLVADAIHQNPRAGLLYSDEDKLDASGQRCEPHFKPDWNRDLLYGLNYINHLTVMRRSLVMELGGLREGFDGSQDYDLLLRLVEELDDDQIVHLPYVLYHWRMAESSTARSDAAKDHTTQASIRALEAHFGRRGQDVRVSSHRPNFFRAHWPLPEPAPLVSLLMPTRDGVAVLRNAIESIRGKTTYPSWELLIIDNGSKEPETFAYFDSLRSDPRIRIVRDDRPFNFAALNNAGVAHARGELLGLINNDVEVITPGWLDEMVSLAMREGTGCVGAKLYYPNETVQHAGVITGLGGVAGHSHKHIPRESAGYVGRLLLIQEMSAVTAACLVVRRSIYETLGGLDEERFAVAFNDVDFCLRVREAGYRNVFTPFAELYHHESVTRGSDESKANRARFEREVAAMKERWGEKLRADPSYSPNLTLDREDFSIAARVVRPRG